MSSWIPRWRSFIAIGFCATYSTYSSFAFETLVLIERNQWFNAAVYVLIMNVACLVAVVLGAAAARSL
ncbi:MAG: CrcB family protein [Bryobacterales bacterium]|nr:CrcB family protein [Bryobacterales bacterium]